MSDSSYRIRDNSEAGIPIQPFNHPRKESIKSHVKAFRSTVDFWQRKHGSDQPPCVEPHERDLSDGSRKWLVYTPSSKVLVHFSDGECLVGNP
ncbi:hypothetical protein P9112_003077 [Eukaryota sp. TZLM1-RC]